MRVMDINLRHGHAVWCVFYAPVRTRRLCGYPCEHGNATRTTEAARTETEPWGLGGGWVHGVLICLDEAGL